MTWTCTYCHSNDHHGRECPEKCAKEGNVREYWVIRHYAAEWLRGDDWVTNRALAERFTQSEVRARVKLLSPHMREFIHIIHVTVRSAADRKALEAKLGEALGVVRVAAFAHYICGDNPHECRICGRAARVTAAIVHDPDCPVGRVLA